MRRRSFIKQLTAGSAGIALAGCNRAESSRQNTAKPVLMKLGCQYGDASEENLAFKARHGVYHFDPGRPREIEGVGWDLDHSLEIVEAADKYEISVDAYHLPRFTHSMLGKSPERDREIEIIQQMIQVAAKSDVRLLLYNTTLLPMVRTGRTIDPARGNAIYSTFDYEEAASRGMDRESTEAGVVDADEMYERITYLLDRLLPVAEEYNVKLGNHIADPPLPAGFRGITRWNSPDVFEGIKRFARLYDSPSHGLNLCLGSTAEGLRDPATEIFPIIEWVGKRRQIFNIHLRNIKGGWGHFQEVYPDNGDVNFVQVMRALRDVEYDGMVMPDHVPQHDDPAGYLQGFAFAYGYIRALIQMLETIK
ncbi:MAG: mannonate dehydratase [Balneolaceae bacterium]